MKRRNKTHLFVACAFREDFELSELSPEWQKNQVVKDRKDVKAKPAVGGGTVYAYAYGAVVFADVDPAERDYELKSLAGEMKLDLNQKVTTEEFTVIESGGWKVEPERLRLDRLTPERTAVVARVLSQSVAMEYYEGVASQIKTTVLDLSASLKNHGAVRMSPRRLYRIVGDALTMRNEIVTVLHALDRPDLIWSDTEMDLIFDDFRAAFDLNERFQALEYKLKVVQDTLETVVNTAQDTRLYNADLIILILIAIEIAISLVPFFTHWGL